MRVFQSLIVLLAGNNAIFPPGLFPVAQADTNRVRAAAFFSQNEATSGHIVPYWRRNHYVKIEFRMAGVA